MTDHSADIEKLRSDEVIGTNSYGLKTSDVLNTAADLLEMHDRTSLSLDDWPAARSLVESLIGHPITENEA